MHLLKLEWEKLKSSSLARNAGWMLLGQGLGLISQALYFVFLARLLGTAEYGVYAGTFAFVSLVGHYSALGSDTVFVRYVSGNRKDFGAYWGNILILISGLSLVVAYLLHLVVAHWVLNPASASIVFPAAIGMSFCNQIALAAGRVFQTYEQLRITASMNLLTNVLRLIAAVLMVAALHHATARQWVLASLCVSFIGAMVAAATVSIRLGLPKFQLGLIRKHAVEVQYSFSQSTSSVYNDLDKTMLSHYGLNIENGIYSMAYRGVEIASIPIFSLRDAAVPRLFVQGAKGIQHSYALGRALLNRAVWLGLAVAAGIFLLAPIIPYVAGHGFAQSVNALRWLCLIPFFRSIHQMTGAAFTGAGLQRYRTTTQCIAAGANFALNLWLIPLHGWLGAAWASLLTDGGLGIMNWAIASRLANAVRRRSVATSA